MAYSTADSSSWSGRNQRRRHCRLRLEGQIDHLGPGGDGVVNSRRLVHAVAAARVVEDLDVDDLGVPAQAGDADAVVGGGGDYAGHERAVAVFVIGRGAQRPVVRTHIRPDDHLALSWGGWGRPLCPARPPGRSGCRWLRPRRRRRVRPTVGLAVRVHDRCPAPANGFSTVTGFVGPQVWS